MSVKSEKDIAVLRACGNKLAHVMTHVLSSINSGMSAQELDSIAEEEMKRTGGIPAFKGYAGDSSPFPAAICVSINDEIVHGIPTKEKIFSEGDIVSVDMGLVYGGLIADMAKSVIVGAGDAAAKKLLQATEQALMKGIEAIHGGGHVGDIGSAIEMHITPFKYGIIRELVGHGVGYSLHEDPQIPNFGKAGTGDRLEAGMVIAIEPMITENGEDIITHPDGWTISTKDGSRAAHFEHTVLVTEDGYEILTIE
ncbi:MAG: type I methionyl aminopeptidase [Candidatus Niyogibacteria bacterium CG10_big_fil_rev_8_21_14_0_10_46_36]|uniref:Methionine aminopeptidase n=1 Tax=Candidatus Niyogibacteria bacterium CG10_big_fil_rev_8_21_14_0_10_46_36 TaxID=1974726 RepID=A0A2H0TCD2_9BACT|nr:MAG: type I methionyl aminopeptidase [Candidatus Niyogibacteria bacterium CG10_big_fil_rev_8_21_14_0_10_46_36]